MRRQGSERRTKAAKVEEKERDSSAKEGETRADQPTGSGALPPALDVLLSAFAVETES
jgi:hypothetical protein